MNHHQRPVADILANTLGDEYHFVTTQPMPNIFINTGYKNQDDLQYIIPYYKEENKATVRDLVTSADAVIIGGTKVPDLVDLRLSTKKLLLFYSERWHKRIRSYFALPIRYLNGTIYKRFMRFNCENAYMLCASAFVPNDCRWSMCFYGKTYKWGYFPPFNELDIKQLQENRKTHKKLRLLSVCRMLDWKHPELSLQIAKKLRDNGYDFHLTMVGGVFEADKKSKRIMDYCLKYKSNNNLDGFVDILGPLKNEEVCRLYENTDIFLFTSDRNEGWGAVLNEAMSRGCAVVASDMIGSVPYLVENGYSGFTFKSGNVDDLYRKVEKLFNNQEIRLSMGENAYNLIKTKWSPNVAANRLLSLCGHLIKNKETEFNDGPCSKAYPVKN